MHGATVAFGSPEHSPWLRPEADVIATADPHVAVGVRVADCVPILLAEDSGRAVAAVHAGWRGTAARAAIAGVEAMQRYGVRPERLVAAVGPSIGPCCYEVGEGTFDAFREAGHHEALLGRWFDPNRTPESITSISGAPRAISSRAAGLLPANVHVAGLCTMTHQETFHSYRAHGKQAGRMLAAIRTPQPAR